MPKVFICYRRDDSIETAGRIFFWLKMRLPEGDVFFDVNTIRPGIDFRRAITDALADEVQVVLVVIGRNWIESPSEFGEMRRRLEDPDDQVRHEIEAAFQYSKSTIPVLVQGAKAPRREDLPASISALADINALAVRPEPDFDNDMRRLRAAMLSLTPAIPFGPPVAPATPYAPPPGEPAIPYAPPYGYYPAPKPIYEYPQISTQSPPPIYASPTDQQPPYPLPMSNPLPLPIGQQPRRGLRALLARIFRT